MWVFSDWYRDWFTTYSDEVFYSTLNKATKLRSSIFDFNLEFNIFVECMTIQEGVCAMLFVVFLN